MSHGGKTVSEAATRRAGRVSATILQRVVAGLQGRSSFHEPLEKYTSFKIGGPADVLVEPVDVEDVARVVKQASANRVPIFVLGGTNVLIRDGGIRGVVMSLSKLRAIREEPGHVLYAEGGVGMPTLIGYAVRRGLTGVEWGAGIPGTVAGCVVMNAGTRLGEMKDAVKAVRLVTPKGAVIDLNASDIEFEYRHARLPRGVVVGVWFQLQAGVRAAIEKTVKDYLQYRKDTQPLALPSAGCVFRNPPRDSAGRLVEGAGLKGARVGDAQVSERHANFVVNVGKARAKDVLDLIKKVRREVRRQTGVSLDLELKVVGQA
jgi:UDP-N-acetylmuramate dehydrogenase